MSVLKNGRWHHYLILMAVLLLAFGLRLYRLDFQSLWWDEGISLHLATAGWGDIIANRVINIHPPLYFFALKGWVALVGQSPFAARYFSLLGSLLQVALIVPFMRIMVLPQRSSSGYDGSSRKWYWLAALLVAIAPLSIVYGQEARAYAWLPLVYLGLLALTHRLLSENDGRKAPYLVIALLEWTGLHLHYITFFIVAYVGLWGLVRLWRDSRIQELRRWIALHLAVVLVSSPWLLAVAFNWTAVQAEANAGTFLAEAAPLDFLLSQVWIFHLTGLAEALADPLVWRLAVLTAVLLVMLLILARLGRRLTSSTISLLFHWLLPLGLALIVWGVRSFSHPRYISMYTIGLIPLTVAILHDGSRGLFGYKNKSIRRIAVYVVITPLLLLISFFSVWSLSHYYYDAAYSKKDMRAVAGYLEGIAIERDVIIVPDTDWSFPFEYEGAGTITMLDLGQPDGLGQNGAQWPDNGRFFVVDYARGRTLDWQNRLPVIMENIADLEYIEADLFDGLMVRHYQPHMVSVPDFEKKIGRFGAITLTGQAWDDPVAAHSAIPIWLQWELSSPIADRYRVAVRLLDEDGWELAAINDLMLTSDGRPTELWQPGEIIKTAHLLPIPPGVPPLTYRLAVTIYALDGERLRPIDLLNEAGAPQGQQLNLGEVAVMEGNGTNPYNLPLPVSVAPNRVADLILEGFDIDKQEAGPGQSLFVQLLWRGPPDPLSFAAEPHIKLVQDDGVLATANSPVLSRYPTDLWSPNAIVLEHRRLIVPPDAAGKATIVLELNGQQLTLTDLIIAGEVRLLAPPLVQYPLDVQFGEVARLIGFDLPALSVSASEPVALTLYWQALQSGIATDYTMFGHILAQDNRLVGQHDAPPDNGRRPTTGWLAEEYVVDLHPLVWREAYQGQAVIEVGIYDPVTGDRLLTPSGADFIYLPVELEVSP